MANGAYFPLEELQPSDRHKVNVFNALFQAYSECEKHCSGTKDWDHLVRVASKHELCKKYGIRMHTDRYDTYPVFNDLRGNIECFGFAHDNWDWCTHADMYYAMSNPDGFKESPYFIDPNAKTAAPQKNKSVKNKPAKIEKQKSLVSESTVAPVENSKTQTSTIALLSVIIMVLLVIIFYLL